MILHDDNALFLSLLRDAGEWSGIPTHYLEKDYWVTRSLKLLACSDYSDRIIFKGGTSLSKAHKIITRFSEDIDLAVLDLEQSGNRIKTLLKKTEAIMKQGLSLVKNHNQESKGSVFRKTAYNYDKITEASHYGQVSREILLEVTAFTAPVPYSKKTIISYIGEFLKTNDQTALIDRFELDSFTLNTLNVERTLLEKIMGVVKHSYAENINSAYENKIRHFYDIALILREPKYKDFMNSKNAINLLQEVVKAEKAIPGNIKKDWLKHPLSQAIIFKSVDTMIPKLSAYMQGDFKDMVFRQNIPDDLELRTVLMSVFDTLLKFDKSRETNTTNIHV